MTSAQQRLCRARASRSGRASTCRRSRPRPSARSRRPRRCARRAPPMPRARSATPTTRRSCEEETARAVRWQEEIGLDVLVHGEFERNDMVAVFRRAACRLRLHQARLGAVLRLALRAAADPVRRRLASEADDGRLVALCAVADGEADEGHADRSGHHPATGRSCATIIPRSAACRQIALAIRDEVADLEQAGVDDDPDRRGGAARRLAAAQERMARLSRLGGRMLPAVLVRRARRRRRSTPTCATPSSTTSSRRSPRWMPT